MKILQSIFFAVFFFFVLASAVKPENLNLSFRRISPVGGFTYSSINSIGEDANGFIWFGTVHGLYRYNTVDVKKFVHNPKDSTTIPGNSIQTIFCDNSGTLWIGTNQGMCIYDNTTGEFKTVVLHDQSGQELGNNVLCIFQGSGQTIYFLSSTMFGIYNPESKKFEKISIPHKVDENFSVATFDSRGTAWIGGSNGTIWQYKTGDQEAHEFFHNYSEAVRKIFADDQGIWIAYMWSGLDYVGLQGDLVAHYGNGPNDVNRINHNRVRDIYKDAEGRIWISTYKGISIIEKGKILNIQPKEISGLPYNSVYKIFQDSKNGIWIGTWSGGLAYRSDFDNQFIQTSIDRTRTILNDEFVSSFAEQSDGKIIVGTEFGKLYQLNPNTNQLDNMPYMVENGKNIENIKSLAFDKKTETLWVGTFLDGLWYKRKNDLILRNISKFPDPRTSVYALTSADSGLWIGTYVNGLFFLNTSSGEMTQYISNPDDSTTISSNLIRAIMIGKDNSLWIGTDNGLNHFNQQTQKFKRYRYQPNKNNTLSADEIFALHQEKSGQIWIGTSGGGLNKFNEETETFKSYEVKDGLTGNDVYGIQEDKEGILWISTDNGITSFNPVDNKFRSFYREAELQGNQFNPGASFMTSGGKILFGDTRGVTLFTPEKMKSNPFQPKAIITSLLINNVYVDNHTLDSPLTKSIQTASELKLSHLQNSLTFSFVANNFLLPNKNKFKYRLVNYDNNWIYSGTQNFATFTKIPPGEYTFEVIASNNDDLWNNTPTSIQIKIAPPFWLTWYAYIIYAITLVLIFYFIRKYFLDRQKFKRDLVLQRLLHESEVQVQEMKLRFFTNISHEFRTPLTLIASPAKHLLEKFKLEPAVREHLLTMQRNSIRLLRLINQLIDIRKIESGKSVFQPQKTDVIALCRDVISYFEMEARDKNIHLSFRPEIEKMNIPLDPEKADKIFFNILSNAMKFTEENGTITISVFSTDSDKNSIEDVVVGETINGKIVCVEFVDNGQGIDSKEITSIFERFAQGENHQSSGTGIGLHMAYEYIRMHKGNIRVKSNKGEGSTFTICFPLTENLDHIQESSVDTDFIISHKGVGEELWASEPQTEKEKAITILIIEDNYELRNYLKNLLNQIYRVVTASNGKQGLETALTILPDLVITDVMMPQMDGLEVCRQLKNDIQTSHIPVILLTALNEPEKQVGGFQSGADAYITKPFDENILIALIQNLIQSRKKLRDIYSVSASDWTNGMEFMSSDRRLIEKATAIIEKHLNDNTFVIEQLATELGISTSSLFRKLKVLTNQSPTEFIRYIRLKKAIKLMNEGNSNIDEISFVVGFNSHSYFTSSFKKQFGKTPSEYLNDMRTMKTDTNSNKD